jgi:hypothetical protein
MAIPSGSGTEVLKRATIHDNNNATTEILSGVANHIYTILSITCADQTGSAQNIAIRMNDGANEIYILSTTLLPANGSFCWNDKFVLTGDDDLDVFNSGAQGDWMVSYIDQDFT